MNNQKRRNYLAKVKGNLKQLTTTLIIILTILTVSLILTTCGGNSSDNNSDNNASNNNEHLGVVTGQPLSDPQSLAQKLVSVENQLRPQFEESWFLQLDDYVNNYRDSTGNLNPLEALSGVMFASVLEDNVYPFCIAAIRAFKIQPTNPLILNSVAMCLLIINNTTQFAGQTLQLSGQSLDLAYDIAPELYLTWENAAAWFHANGRVDDAISAMNNVLKLESDSAFTMWSAAEYAAWNGRPAAVDHFRSLLPSNYPLQNSDGTVGGKAPPKQCIACGCHYGYYDNIGDCIENCPATLDCFTDICTPSNCCGDLSPFSFSLKGKFCYPPTGVQGCFAADLKGNMEISLGRDLAKVVNVGVKAKFSFSENAESVKFTGLSIYSKLANVLEVSFDPLNKKFASSFTPSSVKIDAISSLGFSIGLPTLEKLKFIALCLLDDVSSSIDSECPVPTLQFPSFPLRRDLIPTARGLPLKLPSFGFIRAKSSHVLY